MNATAPQPSVLLVGSATWSDTLSAVLSECPGVAVRKVETAAETVHALLTQSWTLVAFLLDGNTANVLEMAASFDGISRGQQSVGGNALRLGLRPSGFPPTATIPAGIDRLEACPVSSSDWIQWLTPVSGPAEDELSFDPEQLIDRMMGNEMLAKRVVSVFLADAPRQLLALAEALAQEDASTSSRIAHSIRGAASNAGGDALIELARGIESGCKAGEFQRARQMLPELSDQFSRLKPKLEAFVS